MKQIILTFLLCTMGISAFAQTKSETLEQLNGMKSKVTDYWSLYVKPGPATGKTLEFSETQIKVFDKAGNWTTFNWGDIKDVKHIAGNHEIKMFYSGQSNGQTYFISLQTSASMSVKCYNMIKHMAEVNGAKLGGDDIFGGKLR